MFLFIFRISPTDLKIVSGVLNNTVGSSDENKVGLNVTDIFVHEKYKDGSNINDIVLLKVGKNLMYEKKKFYIPLDKKQTCHEMQF
jgi:hypothetical protein